MVVQRPFCGPKAGLKRRCYAGSARTIRELIENNPRYERRRWQMLTITRLAYAGFYLTRKSFAVAKVEMGEGTAIGLTTLQMSWIDGLI